MMTLNRLAVFMGLSFITLTANAGTLNKDGWDTNDCGTRPAAPELNYNSVNEFNDSLIVFTDWQQQSRVYFDCLVKEANGDIKKINDTVYGKQKEHNELVQSITSDAEAYKQKKESDNAARQQSGQ